MSQPPISEAPDPSPAESSASDLATAAEINPAESQPTLPSLQPKPSYVKLAMRNMVRKRGISIYHFFLTVVGLLAFFVGLAYLTH